MGQVCRAVAALVGGLVACNPAREIDAKRLASLPVPAEYRVGEGLFERSCASCHGEQGLGTDSGPPLVHSVYRPSHHGDAAFVIAVERGVRAHHWRFGDMAPVQGVTTEEVSEITKYVRWLQREVGIR